MRKYKGTVRKATEFLISKQQASGEIGSNGTYQSGGGYNHAVAGLALAEAAAMGRLEQTKAAAQKAIAWSTEVAQQKGKDEYARYGWRYRPGLYPDISVTGWYTMQLKSAKVAGLRVDPAAFEGAAAFLGRVSVKETRDGYNVEKFFYKPDEDPKAPEDGGANYGNRPTNSTTAIGMLCRLFLGAPPAELQGSGDYLLENLPQWPAGPDEGGNTIEKVKTGWKGFYYWYYGTLAMFQIGGEHWKKWNAALKELLVSKQCKAGDLDGSWDPVERCGWVGGRAYTTAMGALCLEVYYRYLPMYR